MRFRKIGEDQIDPTRVTLRPIRADDGTLLGRVSTQAFDESGETDMMTTAAADPPLEQAVQFATQLAEFKEQDVDVFDPDALWPHELGQLG